MDPNSLARSDVFFIITTVALIILTAILAVGLIYVVTILRTVKRISNKAEFLTDVLSNDLSQLRDDIKRNGLRLATFLTFFKGLSRSRVNQKRK